MEWSTDSSWCSIESSIRIIIIGFCIPEIYGEDEEENIAMVVSLSTSSTMSMLLCIPKNSTNKICSKEVITGRSNYESFVRKANIIQPINFGFGHLS